MKGSLILFSLFAMIVCGIGSVAAQPSASWESRQCNFGTLHASAGSVKHTLRIVNQGKSPLLLLRSETTCTCTKVRFSHRPIAPNGETILEISYDPRGQKGVFLKAIKFYTNESEKPFILTIKGEVVP